MWNCICECGKTAVVRAKLLLNGDTQSCHCLRWERLGESIRKHGESGTPEYRSWAAMLQRCLNPKDASYHRYGGRGITVCKRWLKLENFLSDMGKRGDGLSLDRINNNGNYEPGNCRWATTKQQHANTRANRHISFNGKTMPVGHWASYLGINSRTLIKRLNAGWPVKTALTKPIDHRFSRTQPESPEQLSLLQA